MKIIFLFFLLIAPNSFANQEYKPDKKTADWLLEIEQYLNQTKYFYADFIQKSAEENSFGSLYISRPGKLKMTYNSPNKLEVIINNSVFLYHNKDLGERSYLRSANFPISFLTRDNISFLDKNDNILLKYAIIKNNLGLISMSLILEDGIYSNFRLAFEFDPIRLKFIEVFDANNKSIHIKIISPKYNQKIDNKIFITAQ